MERYRACDVCGYNGLSSPGGSPSSSPLVVGLPCPWMSCEGRVEEYVPASQLAGAVSDALRLREYIKESEGIGPLDDDEALAICDRLIATLGGR